MAAFTRFLLALAALALAPQAVAQTKLTVGFTGANAFMPAFVAKDQGFFAKRGLDVTMQLVPIGSTLPGALASGSLQVGGLTAPVFLLANEGGIELQIAAGSSLQSKANPTVGVVAREGLNIKTAADFRGKKVGAPGLNGVNHVIFLKWLKNGGVDPRQVTFVEASFPQMGDMLKGGQIDAALPVEPFLGRISQTKAGYQVSLYAAETAEVYLESFWVMSKQFVQANPGAPAAFREAIREGVAFVAKNPEAARKTQTTYLKLPEQIAMTIKLPTYTVDVQPAEVQYWIDLCKDFGITKGTVGAAQLLAK